MAGKITKKKEDQELIALLVAHEVGMRTLYRKYAKKFPELEQFWLKIAAEEQEHIKRLGTLKRRAPIKDVNLFKDRMKIGAIKTSIYFLRRELESLDRLKDINEAFALALDFENSMLEKKFFDVFNIFTPKMEKILNFLETETHKHINELKKQYDRIRKPKKNS